MSSSGLNKLVPVSLVAAMVLAGVLVYRHSVGTSGGAVFISPSGPAEALSELRSGNSRFIQSARTRSTDTAHDAELRHTTAQGQHPFAAILACSDSRVCPDFIFDQPEGSLFEIRNAGNLVDEDVLGSLEYAVEHLHIPLILVLGHKRCGAIQAVYEAGDEPLHDHLAALQEHMPSVRQYVHQHLGEHGERSKILDGLSKENARQQLLTLLKESRPLKAAIEHGSTRLLYGLYDVETGGVEFYEP